MSSRQRGLSIFEIAELVVSQASDSSGKQTTAPVLSSPDRACPEVPLRSPRKSSSHSTIPKRRHSHHLKKSQTSEKVKELTSMPLPVALDSLTPPHEASSRRNSRKKPLSNAKHSHHSPPERRKSQQQQQQQRRRSQTYIPNPSPCDSAATDNSTISRSWFSSEAIANIPCSSSISSSSSCSSSSSSSSQNGNVAQLSFSPPERGRAAGFLAFANPPEAIQMITRRQSISFGHTTPAFDAEPSASDHPSHEERSQTSHQKPARLDRRISFWMRKRDRGLTETPVESAPEPLQEEPLWAATQDPGFDPVRMSLEPSSSLQAKLQVLPVPAVNLLLRESEDPGAVPDPSSNISALSLPLLLRYLSDPQQGRPALLDMTLLSLPSISPSPAFFRFLVARFYSQEDRDVLEKIRFRLVNLLKHWLQNYFLEDFSREPSLAKDFVQFCQSNLKVAGMSTMARYLLSSFSKKSSLLADQARRDHLQLLPSLSLAGQPPKLLIGQKKLGSLGTPGFRIFKVKAKETARQITLFEMSLFRMIRGREFSNKNWSGALKQELAPNITRFIQRFNTTGLWVASLILRTPHVSSRAVTLAYFIDLANELRLLNNFNGLMAVMSGLQMPPITRLRKTWDLLPSQSWDAWESLSTMVDSLEGWAALKLAMKSASAPMIPHLGLLLHDLVLLMDQNPDTQTSPSGLCLINLSKHRLIYRSITELLELQDIPYCLQPAPAFLQYLKKISPCPAKLLYDISYQLEAPDGLSPRNSIKLTHAPSSSNDELSAQQSVLPIKTIKKPSSPPPPDQPDEIEYDPQQIRDYEAYLEELRQEVEDLMIQGARGFLSFQEAADPVPSSIDLASMVTPR